LKHGSSLQGWGSAAASDSRTADEEEEEEDEEEEEEEEEEEDADEDIAETAADSRSSSWASLRVSLSPCAAPPERTPQRQQAASWARPQVSLTSSHIAMRTSNKVARGLERLCLVSIVRGSPISRHQRDTRFLKKTAR
jgi:hypothetical protein